MILFIRGGQHIYCEFLLNDIMPRLGSLLFIPVTQVVSYIIMSHYVMVVSISYVICLIRGGLSVHHT